MKTKLNHVFKIIILSFLISPFLIPLTVNAQQGNYSSCDIRNIQPPRTAEASCALTGQVLASNSNCYGMGMNPPANQICCCTIKPPDIPVEAPIVPVRKSPRCTWRIKTHYYINGNWEGGCTDQEVIGTECDPNTKPKASDSSNYNTYVQCCCINDQPKFVADVIIPQLSINIDTIKLTEKIYCDGEDATGNCYYPWIAEYINGIYKYGFGIAGILAAIMLMAGGIIWLISAGDATKISQAKDIITGSIIGLIILSTSYIILRTINPNLTSLKHISMKTIDRIAPDEVKSPEDQKENPYQEGCDAARRGDLSVCESYDNNPPASMKDIPGTNQKATEDVINRYLSAMDCVKEKNGGKDMFSVNEGWRSPATQLRYKKQLGDKAATPCCSNHGKGTALDLKRIDGIQMSWSNNDSTGLTACMNAQGMNANLKGLGKDPNEPWHWSPSGR